MEKRILKEISNAHKNPALEFYYDSEGAFGIPKTGYLKFMIKSGIYLGQTHIISFEFEYGTNIKYQFPISPPNVKFITPIWHPNISESGSICLDVIKDKWSSFYGIETIFNSILLLLEEPNLNSPLNSKASGEYKSGNFKRICWDKYMSGVQNSAKISELLRSPIFQFEKSA